MTAPYAYLMAITMLAFCGVAALVIVKTVDAFDK